MTFYIVLVSIESALLPLIISLCCCLSRCYVFIIALLGFKLYSWASTLVVYSPAVSFQRSILLKSRITSIVLTGLLLQNLHYGTIFCFHHIYTSVCMAFVVCYLDLWPEWSISKVSWRFVTWVLCSLHKVHFERQQTFWHHVASSSLYAKHAV